MTPQDLTLVQSLLLSKDPEKLEAAALIERLSQTKRSEVKLKEEIADLRKRLDYLSTMFLTQWEYCNPATNTLEQTWLYYHIVNGRAAENLVLLNLTKDNSHE